MSRPTMVTISKNLTSMSFSSTALKILSQASTTYSMELFCPLIWIRSLKLLMWGLVNMPVLYPSFCKHWDVLSDTDPFPFVPAMWIILEESRCGFPKVSQSYCICDKLRSALLTGTLFLKTPQVNIWLRHWQYLCVRSSFWLFLSICWSFGYSMFSYLES